MRETRGCTPCGKSTSVSNTADLYIANLAEIVKVQNKKFSDDGKDTLCAKEIVERHGGTITAESEKETISFLVRIPQRQPTVIVEKS